MNANKGYMNQAKNGMRKYKIKIVLHAHVCLNVNKKLDFFLAI